MTSTPNLSTVTGTLRAKLAAIEAEIDTASNDFAVLRAASSLYLKAGGANTFRVAHVLDADVLLVADAESLALELRPTGTTPAGTRAEVVPYRVALKDERDAVLELLAAIGDA